MKQLVKAGKGTTQHEKMEQFQELTQGWEIFVFSSTRVENLVIQRKLERTQKSIASAEGKLTID